MQCKYTNFAIERRFGVPQTNDENHLVGCFASVGVAIRYILDRVEEDSGSYTSNTLGMISRIGKMIGKPLTIKRSVKEGSGEAELTFSSSELTEIVKLAAPSNKDLEINGGKLSRKEYLAKDPTSGPEYHKYGQTKEEFEKQKEETRKKKEETRKKKEYSDSDHARYFFFTTPETGGEKLKDVMSRVTLSAIEEVKFLENAKKVYFVEVGKTGLRAAYCGGNTHNKLATKKFWGKDWKEKPMLKGEVLIVCTGNAPLNIDEAMPPDDDWVKKRTASDIAVVAPASKKQKKQT